MRTHNSRRRRRRRKKKNNGREDEVEGKREGGREKRDKRKGREFRRI